MLHEISKIPFLLKAQNKTGKKRGNKPKNMYGLIGLVYKNTSWSDCIKNSLTGL